MMETEQTIDSVRFRKCSSIVRKQKGSTLSGGYPINDKIKPDRTEQIPLGVNRSILVKRELRL